MTEKQNGEAERGNWSGKLDFFLSAVGYAVGLGNVWRFPYLAYKNGGASFLFPYIIMLIIAGLPLFFIELAIGQFTSEGPITCWRMAPAFMGIGYAMVIVSAVVSIYYNMIIAYAIYYMLVSFVSLDEELPWKKCDQAWNTDMCRYEKLPRLTGDNETQQYETLYEYLYNKTCVQNMMIPAAYDDYNQAAGYSKMYDEFLDGFLKKFNVSSVVITPMRITEYDGYTNCAFKYTTPSEEYYERYVLNQADNVNLNDIGPVSLKLILTLLLAWILIFGCLMKGIKTSGKVVYFTATFPYVILIVLLIRGLTLTGFEEGVEFYVIPDWNKLTDATIWGAAATQIFYSLGIGFGGLLTMASYNKFKNNCFRDAVLVACINCGTSIFAGFAIFSLLGHMAYVTNKKVQDVATSGAGLAFIAYPDGITRLPAAPVWAFLFFFMILTLGMDSQFAMMETVISAISDIFPNFLRRKKTPFTFIVCMIGFLLGIPLCTEGGGRVLTLMNDYSGSYNLMIIALFELICLCYIYGIKKFRLDIEMMIGAKSDYFWWYWYATWAFISPAAVIFIVVVSAIQYVPSKYEGTEILDWAEGIGWLMVVAPIAAFLFVGLYQICALGFKKSMKPTANWGPAMPENQVGRYAHLATQGAYNNYALDSLDNVVADNEKSNPPTYNGHYPEKKEGGFDNPAMVDERL
ncbi:sodium-dependent proline transporter isoform X2 [Aplysia californica]|uniref:Transporter n=1 Tax=Aplysia californica TaxID=6500 RepID=A0ABM0JKK5_APLCA|nr:sodium-dependent proline transporter isoform X2 [Aplysia californica]